MTSSTKEVWRDIPGYEGRYQASNLGRIRSQARGVLKPFKNKNGYLINIFTNSEFFVSIWVTITNTLSLLGYKGCEYLEMEI